MLTNQLARLGHRPGDRQANAIEHGFFTQLHHICGDVLQACLTDKSSDVIGQAA